MIVIVIQHIILYKRIFAVFLEFISYHYIFTKIDRVIKLLFLYLINC